jgi:hypothetical protein
MHSSIAAGIVLLALTNTAAASGDKFGLVGLGTSVVDGASGWMFRTEHRNDFVDTDVDEASAIVGGRIGIELWRVADQTGFSVPLGFYVGGQVDSVRATLGGGVGLWAFTVRDRDSNDGGAAPFVSSTVDVRFGKLLMSLDARISRQVHDSSDNFNVYSFMIMVGK